ncbi:D-glycero-beta-D-manno-heptose-1,7-bisphosphate 7-phosphatase [archaeon]|nr:D-glycero-beta-D-manno-heptose-1,7-bisphosphate 7-phosphatase [archaeon]|tara:strand:- start:2403 stop:2963 length:561 start_codon:yes stop_codon:yes gene_type:complete
MNKAIFFDRDGTINVDKGYVYKLEDLEFEKNAIEGLKELTKTEYKLIVITSQSGVGRGYYTEEDMHKFNHELIRRLNEKGIKIENIYFCPHHPEKGIGKYKVDCDCRKPEPGLIMGAKNEYNLTLQDSIMIGDKTSDIEVGKRSRCKTILVKTGEGGKDKSYNIKPDYVADDLLDAAKWILNNKNE